MKSRPKATGYQKKTIIASSHPGCSALTDEARTIPMNVLSTDDPIANPVPKDSKEPGIKQIVAIM